MPTMPSARRAPRVSVIMSVWNNEDYVVYTVSSILRQTFTDFEFLILDDHGGDDSIRRVRKFKDKRIRIIDNGKNIGFAASLNRGLEEAQGEYIAVIDADDIALPTRLEKQVDYLDRHKQVVLLGTSGYNIAADGSFTDLVLQPEKDVDMRFQMLVSPPFYHPSVMYRRATVMEHNLRYNPEDKAALDSRFVWDIGQHGKLANLREPLILYRVHAASTSVKHQERQLQEKMAITRQAMQRMEFPSEEITHDLEVIERILRRDDHSMHNMRVVTEGLDQLMRTYCRLQGLDHPTPIMHAMAGRWKLKAIGRHSSWEMRWWGAHYLLARAKKDVYYYLRSQPEILRQRKRFIASDWRYPLHMAYRPRISIIMPAYNTGEFIGRTINSLLHQTYNNYELIIIDDKSTDNTAKVIDSFHDPRIIFLRNKNNIGSSASLNRALRQAKGEFIARMDADDICHPERLERQVRYMEEHSRVVMVGSAGYTIDPQDRLMKPCLQPRTHQAIAFQQLLMPAFYHPSVMYRAQVIREHSMEYNPELLIGEDMDFWNRMLVHGEGHNLIDPLIFYRKHDTSTCARHRQKIVQYIQQVSTPRVRELRPIGEFSENTNRVIEILQACEPVSRDDIAFLFKTLRQLLACYSREHMVSRLVPLRAMVVKWTLKAIWFTPSYSFRLRMMAHFLAIQPAYSYAFLAYSVKLAGWKCLQQLKSYRYRRFLP